MLPARTSVQRSAATGNSPPPARAQRLRLPLANHDQMELRALVANHGGRLGQNIQALVAVQTAAVQSHQTIPRYAELKPGRLRAACRLVVVLPYELRCIDRIVNHGDPARGNARPQHHLAGKRSVSEPVIDASEYHRLNPSRIGRRSPA